MKSPETPNPSPPRTGPRSRHLRPTTACPELVEGPLFHPPSGAAPAPPVSELSVAGRAEGAEGGSRGAGTARRGGIARERLDGPRFTTTSSLPVASRASGQVPKIPDWEQKFAKGKAMNHRGTQPTSAPCAFHPSSRDLPARREPLPTSCQVQRLVRRRNLAQWRLA
jgi:hypothetical protein